MPFTIQSRADLMTPETVDALQQAGCDEVWMGVESGSQKILDAMDKGLLVEEVQEARDHDPLVEFGAYLTAHDILDDAGQEALRATVKAEIDGHIAAAWEAADPDPETSLRHVFAEDA